MAVTVATIKATLLGHKSRSFDLRFSRSQYYAAGDTAGMGSYSFDSMPALLSASEDGRILGN